MKLNECIIAIRCELQAKNLKKSGKNKFAGFAYFELSDFLPTLNELLKKYGVNDLFTIKDGKAILTLILGDEKQDYEIPFVLFDTPINTKYDNQTKSYKQVKSMQDIQYLGALNTYYKRYLYLNAFGITDGDIIDSMDNSNLEEDKINYRKELVKYCEAHALSINELAVKYKLNAKTSNDKFKDVLETLKSEETGEVE